MRFLSILLFVFMAAVGCTSSNLTFEPFIYDNGPDFPSEGLVRICSTSGKVGYADLQGQIVIPPQFAFGFPFKNGQAKVTYEGHNESVDGSNGEIHVWKSDSWFCIDKDGKSVKCKASF